MKYVGMAPWGLDNVVVVVVDAVVVIVVVVAVAVAVAVAVEYIIILIIIIVVLLDFAQLQFCQTVHLETLLFFKALVFPRKVMTRQIDMFVAAVFSCGLHEGI